MFRLWKALHEKGQSSKAQEMRKALILLKRRKGWRIKLTLVLMKSLAITYKDGWKEMTNIFFISAVRYKVVPCSTLKVHTGLTKAGVAMHLATEILGGLKRTWETWYTGPWRKSVIWRNFKFLYMKHVEKAKISPHLDLFQISSHDRFREIWYLLRCVYAVL